MFREATRISTISETYYHYALFLQSQGRIAEAREWSQKILDKKPTMPGYLRRRERPWFRKAELAFGASAQRLRVMSEDAQPRTRTQGVHVAPVGLRW